MFDYCPEVEIEGYLAPCVVLLFMPFREEIKEERDTEQLECLVLCWSGRIEREREIILKDIFCDDN